MLAIIVSMAAVQHQNGTEQKIRIILYYYYVWRRREWTKKRSVKKTKRKQTISLRDKTIFLFWRQLRRHGLISLFFPFIYSICFFMTSFHFRHDFFYIYCVYAVKMVRISNVTHWTQILIQIIVFQIR